jgi:hypothetical protein
MTSFLQNSPRWLYVMCLAGLWAVLSVQACDRNSQNARAQDTVTESTSTEDEAVEDGASELPGEAEPGTIMPEDVGPEAPALFFLAGLKGYLEPCGCSAEVLLGGIDRITGYVEAARELYPATSMVDTGDMLFEHAELAEHDVPQERAKADVIVAAHKKLGTQVTVPGERDLALGVDFYREKIDEIGVEPIAANLILGGQKLAATKILELGEIRLGVVGAVDPTLYEDVDGVEVSEPQEAVEAAVAELAGEGVETVVVLMHGDFSATQSLLSEVDGIDFGVVGHGPRETDQVYAVDGAHTLEAYDQGRYLGVLKLYERAGSTSYANASAASETELEKVEQILAHRKKQLERFSPSQRRENPPILQRINEGIAELEERQHELRTGGVDVPEEGSAFVFRPVPMRPGYPIDEELRDKRADFNKSLGELQAEVAREVPEVEEGQAFFVGTNNCATCHGDAHEFWEKTKHASAVETLEERDKQFDQNCIGCHVVGYEKPGGSVIGKMHYEADLGGRTIEKNLEDVGCETCHGPGSEHVQRPVDSDGKPQHIEGAPAEEACMQCHVPEHSPRFNFDAYVEDITGPGHELKSR